MLDEMFFEIVPLYDLNLIKPNQILYNIAGEIIIRLKPIVDDFNPSYVFVHSETTTTIAGSITDFYSGAKVCHIECRLKTFNKYTSFP